MLGARAGRFEIVRGRSKKAGHEVVGPFSS